MTARRTLYIPDDTWERIQQAAIRESAKRGEVVSASQWLREAAEEKMERERRA